MMVVVVVLGGDGWVPQKCSWGIRMIKVKQERREKKDNIGKYNV